MPVAPGASNELAKIIANAIGSAFNLGSGPGYIEIYDGTRPASVDTPVTTQKLLAVLVLSDPAFGAATDLNPGARITAAAIAPGVGLDDGVASWFRSYDSDDNPYVDGNAGLSDADLILDNLNIAVDQAVSINSWTITQPES